MTSASGARAAGRPMSEPRRGDSSHQGNPSVQLRKSLTDRIIAQARSPNPGAPMTRPPSGTAVSPWTRSACWRGSGRRPAADGSGSGGLTTRLSAAACGLAQCNVREHPDHERAGSHLARTRRLARVGEQALDHVDAVGRPAASASGAGRSRCTGTRAPQRAAQARRRARGAEHRRDAGPLGRVQDLDTAGLLLAAGPTARRGAAACAPSARRGGLRGRGPHPSPSMSSPGARRPVRVPMVRRPGPSVHVRQCARAAGSAPA